VTAGIAHWALLVGCAKKTLAHLLRYMHSLRVSVHLGQIVVISAILTTHAMILAVGDVASRLTKCLVIMVKNGTSPPCVLTEREYMLYACSFEGASVDEAISEHRAQNVHRLSIRTTKALMAHHPSINKLEGMSARIMGAHQQQLSELRAGQFEPVLHQPAPQHPAPRVACTPGAPCSWCA